MLLIVQQNIILKQLCESILDSQKKICFVAVTNEKGKVLESKDRDSAIGYLQKTRYEMFFMEFALQHRMNNEFNSEFSFVRYTLTEREKETFFSFPFYNLQILVVAKNGVNPTLTSKEIISIIDKYSGKFDVETNDKKGLEVHEVFS